MLFCIPAKVTIGTYMAGLFCYDEIGVCMHTLVRTYVHPFIPARSQRGKKITHYTHRQYLAQRSHNRGGFFKHILMEPVNNIIGTILQNGFRSLVQAVSCL